MGDGENGRPTAALRAHHRSTGEARLRQNTVVITQAEPFLQRPLKLQTTTETPATSVAGKRFTRLSTRLAKRRPKPAARRAANLPSLSLGQRNQRSPPTANCSIAEGSVPMVAAAPETNGANKPVKPPHNAMTGSQVSRSRTRYPVDTAADTITAFNQITARGLRPVIEYNEAIRVGTNGVLVISGRNGGP
jgi:hypothetical protein